MKSYKELKAQLDLCYEFAVYLQLQDTFFSKDKFKKFLSNKIDILLNEIKSARENETIFKYLKN